MNFDQSVCCDSFPKKNNVPEIEKDPGKLETCEETVIFWGKRAQNSPSCYSKSPFSVPDAEFGYADLLARKEVLEKLPQTIKSSEKLINLDSSLLLEEQLPELPIALETSNLKNKSELIKLSPEKITQSFDSFSSKKACCTCRKRMCLTFYCPCLRTKKMCLSSCSCPNCKNNEKFAEMREHVIKDLELKYSFKNMKEISPFQVEFSMIADKSYINDHDSALIDPQYFLPTVENPEASAQHDILLVDQEVAIIPNDDKIQFSDTHSCLSITLSKDDPILSHLQKESGDELFGTRNKSKPKLSSHEKCSREESAVIGNPKKRGRKPKNPEVPRPQRTRKNDSQINRKQRLLQLALNNDPVLQGSSPFI